MKLFKLTILALLLCSNCAIANTQDEIDHLLNYVAQTLCKYERNGDIHTGAEAVKHIKKKYNYYKEDITTAEDFIKYSATKSTMSGKSYTLHCSGQAPISSNEWLLLELKKYRLSNK